MYTNLNRRRFLALSVATASAAALAACTRNPEPRTTAERVLPTDPVVTDYESRRPSSGNTVNQPLNAAAFTAAVAGKTVSTWGYNTGLAAPTIRAKAGDRLTVNLNNALQEETSIHWHGLALRNDQDGVPGLTQDPVAAGTEFAYDFRLAHPGTYWYHSHVEMQRERALYGALIIEDPAEKLVYDRDWVIVLDDWMDGITGTPDDVVKELSGGMPMSGSMPGMDHGSMGSTPAPSGGSSGMKHMLMGSRSDFLGGDAGDVSYPFHLFNSKAPDQAEILTATTGQVIRLRIINAAGDTAYRVGIPRQKLTLTHTDGFPVQHQDVDAVVLGMGERIDALLTVREGFTPVMALAEGKTGQALGFISTGTGKQPLPATLPNKLEGTVVDGGQLKADPTVTLADKAPDRTHDVHLTGTMAKYDWGINGNRFDMTKPLENAFDIKAGERVEVNFINDTAMWHPLHLHGHTFQVSGGGARKDTVIVRPKQTVTVIFDADNPGQWLTHCHNAYHAERGMMAVFSYTK
ncbi:MULTISPECIES: multicopper oxidase family protein [Paenarthrobacter]|jgi:FtsP/CotA-like multicopper oxidase with cupredoxin domain|uniref:Multicopper oxidase family protein n=1 Tax=Paenarthrobacter ureafaciens TaxID=37931 RepID=A0AAX3EE11_PAEUR|nr:MULTISPECIES: multicopper oxidase family protein [Paenarthrobacter]NKR12306.1 copper oxidase [Arthrobacter sp. M5]NKR15630.1 copper oxidase [Arthrobacter sp. M6]OEH62284.1 copper oxidase [Arthrobacter sp. D4]OEH62855.1 copper oxidase [Arthrobacter sp. D2]MDO5865011.1 multicopper oxidase family protein [Paenarthrobacter sp. SD-2]